MADKDDKKKEETQLADFTTINPEDLAPELKQLYKSMQADYTRKTQEIATRKKEFDDKESTWQDKLKAYGAAEQELQQWRDWYQSLAEDDGKKTATDSQAATDTKAAKPGELSYLDEPGSEALQKYVNELKTSHTTELSGLKEELKGLRAALRDTTDQTSRMFNYHAQLNELGARYPKLNKKELLDYALKTGQPDLERAYKDLHQDDLIEVEVEKRLKEREKELRTQGIRGPGQQVILRTKEGTPKSFEEANEMILRERAAQGL